MTGAKILEHLGQACEIEQRIHINAKFRAFCRPAFRAASGKLGKKIPVAGNSLSGIGEHLLPFRRKADSASCTFQYGNPKLSLHAPYTGAERLLRHVQRNAGQTQGFVSFHFQKGCKLLQSHGHLRVFPEQKFLSGIRNVPENRGRAQKPSRPPTTPENGARFSPSDTAHTPCVRRMSGNAAPHHAQK